MRPDQITSLSELEERLVDLFVTECKPEEWKAATVGPARDEAWKQKKVASATGALILRVQNSLRELRYGDKDAPGDAPIAPSSATDPDDDLAREAADLEKAGIAILRKASARRKR